MGAAVAAAGAGKAVGGSLGMELLGTAKMGGITEGLGQAKDMMGKFGEGAKKAGSKLKDIGKGFTKTALAAGVAGAAAGAFFKRFREGDGVLGPIQAAISRIRDARKKLDDIRNIPLAKSVLEWEKALLKVTKSEEWDSFKKTLVSIKTWFVDLGTYLLETLWPIFAKIWKYGIEPVLPQLKAIGIVLVAVGAFILGFILAPFVLVAAAIVGIAWILKGIWELAGLIAKAVAGALMKAWEAIKGVVVSIWDWLKSIGTAVVDFIKDLKNLPSKAWDALVGLFDAVKDPFKRAFTWLWDSITGLPGKAWDALTGLYDAVVDPFKRAYRWAEDKLSGLKKKFDWLPGVEGGFDWLSPSTWFDDFIFRAGQKPIAISPNDTLIGAKTDAGLISAVNGLTGSAGGSSSVNINITVNGSMSHNDINYLANRVSSEVQNSWQNRRAV